MRFLLGCGAVFAIAACTFAAPTTTTTATTTTSMPTGTSTCHPKQQTFDDTTSSYTSGDFYSQDLRYTGFKVVPASDKTTWFNAQSKPNLLALKQGTLGVIQVAPHNDYTPSSYFFPGRFFAGCAKLNSSGVAEPVSCQVSLATPEPQYGGGLVTINFPLSPHEGHGRSLVRGEWGGPGTPYINVTVYDGPPGTTLYLDSLQYSVNCIFCEKDFICSN